MRTPHIIPTIFAKVNTKPKKVLNYVLRLNNTLVYSQFLGKYL